MSESLLYSIKLFETVYKRKLTYVSKVLTLDSIQINNLSNIFTSIDEIDLLENYVTLWKNKQSEESKDLLKNTRIYNANVQYSITEHDIFETYFKNNVNFIDNQEGFLKFLNSLTETFNQLNLCEKLKIYYSHKYIKHIFDKTYPEVKQD